MEDSVFHIKTATQLDLNEYNIEYYLNDKNSGTVSTSGLVAKNLIDTLDIKFIQFTGQSSSSKNRNYVLANLRGGVSYSIRLYAIINQDTVYSSGKEIQTQHLKFADMGGPFKGFRPATNVGIVTNLPETNNGVHSRIFIGATECAVVSENGPVIVFNIPETIPAGYNSITLKRKGLEAKYDSAYFYFGKWKSLGEFPLEPLVGYTQPNYLQQYGVFQKGIKGYLFGGAFMNAFDFNTRQVSADYFLEYDYPSNSWTKIMYSTPTYFKMPVVQTVNEEAYIVGGYLDTTRTNGSHIPLPNVYQFDLTNRRWIKKGPIPWGLRGHPVSFASGSKIYIGLGESGIPNGAPVGLNDLWEYDPFADNWTRKANFPGAPRVFAGAFVIEGKAYVVGGSILHRGYNEMVFTNELWEYNLNTDVWRNISYAGEHPAPFAGPATFTFDGKGYIVGSWIRDIGVGYYFLDYARNWRYDPKKRAFEEIVIPISNTHGGVIFRTGNTVVLTGKELPGDLANSSNHVTELKLE